MRRPLIPCIANSRFLYCSFVPQLVFWLSTRTPSPGQCASTTPPKVSEDATDDYDIHIPLSEIPLGVNVGPSLEVLSFAKDPRTGELPWVARRGWLEVGDILVSLVSHEGEYMSEVIIPKARRSRLDVILRHCACTCSVFTQGATSCWHVVRALIREES